ncbi:Uncharacterised protein [Mycobacterium tuberculosis]|uniref:Uncharacterized protein n=1 Tax=Mycobacterium tuberculosis TaxID=1773 RepID=A0A916LC92_MYCTX|nr:Uncharacterised protein [Mycobacterium tuberculosis]
MLQGAHRFTGSQIVGDRASQLPILVIPQAGQALVGKRFPPRLRLYCDGEQRAAGEDHNQCREQPADESDHFGYRRE